MLGLGGAALLGHAVRGMLVGAQVFDLAVSAAVLATIIAVSAGAAPPRPARSQRRSGNRPPRAVAGAAQRKEERRTSPQPEQLAAFAGVAISRPWARAQRAASATSSQLPLAEPRPC